MIGRVGRDPCTQLRGLLRSQTLKLEGEESKIPRNNAAIAAIVRAIEKTKKELDALGCE